MTAVSLDDATMEQLADFLERLKREENGVAR